MFELFFLILNVFLCISEIILIQYELLVLLAKWHAIEYIGENILLTLE